MTVSFSSRAFLRSRQAVLVHFSTVMTSRPELTFPDDMRQAMGLTGIPLAFSTIQRGDTNPFGGGRGGAEGSIGIIVDIGPATVTCSRWMDVATCSAPGGYVSHESTWQGITTGSDNRGYHWSTSRWQGTTTITISPPERR